VERFVIIGLGNFGSSVAEALYGQGHDVIALDVREERVDQVAHHVSRAAVGDGRQTETLENAGAEDADAAVVSTGDDLAASILATMALRDLEVADICVKVISSEHARVMRRLGVTETVFPERESALNLASRLSDRAIINYVHMSGDLSIQEMVVPEAWQGRSLRDLALRAEHGLSVVAVHDVGNDDVTVPPDPDAPLAETDTLLLAGTNDSLDHISETVQE
jgi:trk system potassium uptake protein TrkA